MFNILKFLIPLALLLIIGCGNKDTESIRIGINQWPGYEPIYAAKVKGLFKKNGLNVEILEYFSLNDVKLAYEKGQVDIMCSTLIEMIKAYDDSGISAKVLIPTDFSNGPDVIISRNNINSTEKLKGKRIGVEKGTLGIYMLFRALEKANLRLNDIEIYPVDQTNMAQAFLENKIDVAVTYPPFSVNILKQIKGSKEVFNSGDIPYEIIDVLVVKNELLNKTPKLKEKVNKVWNESLNLLKTNEKEMIEIMANREGISPKEFKEIMDGLVYLDYEKQKELYQEDNKLTKVISKTIEVLFQSKEIKTKMNASIFLD